MLCVYASSNRERHLHSEPPEWCLPSQGYVIIYVHTTLPPENEPPLMWLRKVPDASSGIICSIPFETIGNDDQVYELLDHRLKENLHLLCKHGSVANQENRRFAQPQRRFALGRCGPRIVVVREHPRFTYDTLCVASCFI